MKAAALAISSALALGLLAGCGGGAEPESKPSARPPAPHEPSPPASRRAAPAPTCRPGEEKALGGDRIAYFALARGHARAFRTPGRGEPFASFGRRNVNGFPTVFGVLRAVVGRDCHARWYRVQLPIRPNGATGYVRAGDVRLGSVDTRVVIDLSERRVTLFRDGRQVFHAIGAVGSPATPTPTGRFYVNQLLVPGDPSGPWGPAAIGLSAFSPVLRDWAQGGPIAIHGTNAPSSIGHAASHGCIRLDNAVLRRLFAQTPAGTPVIIRA